VSILKLHELQDKLDELDKVYVLAQASLDAANAVRYEVGQLSTKYAKLLRETEKREL